MSTLSEAFSKVNALTQEGRDAAYDAARRRIAGRRPQYADYEGASTTRFPRWVSTLVSALCVGMLAAAFLPSAMRLHAIALATNAAVLIDVPSTYAAALCVVLMAEIGQVIFSLASATNSKRSYRISLTLGSLICLAIAICGNAVAMGGHALESSVAFLETYAPPVLVLITASVLKSQMLHAIAERHAAQQAFASALASWQQLYDDAETHAAWGRTLANALRDGLRSANKRSSAVLRDLTDADWLALIERERSAEEWYEREAQRQQNSAERSRQAEQKAAPTQTTQRSGTGNGNATGDIAAAQTTQEGSIYVKHCPICEKRFEGHTKRSVTNAVVAHQKSHKAEERAAVDGKLPPADVEHIASTNGHGKDGE